MTFFAKTLRSIGITTKDTTNELQFGSELLLQYEQYWNTIRSRTNVIARNAKLTDAEALALSDYCFRVFDDWAALKAELDTLPSVEGQITQLNDSINALATKLERISSALDIVVDNREEYLLSQWQHKKDSQLTNQAAAHARELAELTQRLETEARAEAQIRLAQIEQDKRIAQQQVQAQARAAAAQAAMQAAAAAVTSAAASVVAPSTTKTAAPPSQPNSSAGASGDHRTECCFGN